MTGFPNIGVLTPLRARRGNLLPQPPRQAVLRVVPAEHVDQHVSRSGKVVDRDRARRAESRIGKVCYGLPRSPVQIRCKKTTVCIDTNVLH